jgi:uncharacterized membrane protein
MLVYFLVALSPLTVMLRLQDVSEDQFYLLLIGVVTLSLLLPGTLISQYITGGDMNVEFALFQQVQQSGVWNPQFNLLYNAALSVSILPSIISIVSSIEGTLVFKVIYPALYSIVPMILYKIYRRLLSPKGAFLSAFVFLAYPTSYVEITQLGREMIAQMLVVLLIWLLISPRVRTRSGGLLIAMLLFGFVISHYSLALIIIGILVFSYLVSLMPYVRSRVRTLANLPVVCLSLVAALSWFLLAASGAVFIRLIVNVNSVLYGLSNFLNPSTRPTELLLAIGASSVDFGALHLVNRGVQYLVVLCLVLGFAVFVCQRHKSETAEMLVLPMLAALGLLLASVILPNLALALNLSRIYQISLIFLAPCFYFGAAEIARVVQKFGAIFTRKRDTIRIGNSFAAAILFTYLLFTSGFVWAITLDTPASVVLDAERMSNSSVALVRSYYYNWYIVPGDVAAARWMESRANPIYLTCADFTSHGHVLTSYGGSYSNGPSLAVQGGPGMCEPATQYVFLSYFNSISGIGWTGTDTFQINLQGLLAENRIYSNGATVYEGFDLSQSSSPNSSG